MKHETLNTLEVTRWCNRCGCSTQHRVSGKRVGACIRCAGTAAGKDGMSKKQEKAAADREELDRNPRFF